MIVSKEFKFCAAHRLMHHTGKCRNVHGHTYKVVVSVCGEMHEEKGMVIDYGDLARVVNPVVDMYDHCIILNQKDKALVDAIAALGYRQVWLKGEPTAENIAMSILHQLKGLNALVDMSTIHVRVYESEGTSAEASSVKS